MSNTHDSMERDAVRKHPLEGLLNIIFSCMAASLKNKHSCHQGMSAFHTHTVPPDLIETKSFDHLIPAFNGACRSSYLGLIKAGSEFRSRVVFSGDYLSWLSTTDLLSLLAAGPDTRPGLGV